MHRIRIPHARTPCLLNPVPLAGEAVREGDPVRSDL
jgi:hypothetical protein